MKCPNCNREISERCNQCPHCAYLFTQNEYEKISLYFDVKEQLAYLNTLKSYLDTSLSSLSDSFGKLEHLITNSPDKPAGKLPNTNNKITPPLKNAAPKPQPATESATTIHTGLSPNGEPAFGPVPGENIASTETRNETEFHFGQKWMLIIGIITTVFAVAYFLKYSFTKGWVGPTGRVVLSYFWGMAFLGLGEWFRKKEYRPFGLSLSGGGIAVLYFSTFAGFQLYHLIPQGISFVIMIVITVFSCVLAIVYNAKWLAVLGVLGGFLTPLLLSAQKPNEITLMTYITILNFGILALSVKKRWHLLESLGFVFTWILYTAWYAVYYKTGVFWPSLVFLIVFFLIYAVLPVAGGFLRRETRSPGNLWFAAPNALIAFGYAFAMVADKYSTPYVAIVTVFIAAIFLALSSLLPKGDAEDDSTFWYLIGNAIFFLVLTVPILFAGLWITIFWALEAALLIWMGLKLKRNWVTITGIALSFFITGKFFLYDYPIVFHTGKTWFIFHLPYTKNLPKRFFTGAVFLGALFFSAKKLRNAAANSWKRLGKLFGVLFGSCLFLTLTIEVSGFFHQYAPRARFSAISVLWAIFASTLMVQGFRLESSAMRKTAIAIFAATLFKVFLIDISHFSTPYRILSFMVLGILLIGSSWLYHRFSGEQNEEKTGMEEK